MLAGAPAQTQLLRYAACAYCQEEQRLYHGVTWLRRDWVIAFRTVCAVHHLPLEEVHAGETAHGVWSAFARRNRKASLSAYSTCEPRQAAPLERPTPLPPEVDPTGMSTRLHQDMALVEEALLTVAASRKRPHRGRSWSRAVIVQDLLWAFTRADRHAPDRLVYEAYASECLDHPWFMSRRRRPGPVDFARLSLESRHFMIATATILTGAPILRWAFRYLPGSRQDDLATIHHHLTNADRNEWQRRQCR
ncbi:hypothetical protein HVPorG_04963 (plasmid) [Roseomonas mucosa]|nr:hypothetical protein HVPorG_04963 [Roseomonas mucosa]